MTGDWIALDARGQTMGNLNRICEWCGLVGALFILLRPGPSAAEPPEGSSQQPAAQVPIAGGEYGYYHVKPFLLDTFEVTAEEYRRCVLAGACERPMTDEWVETDKSAEDVPTYENYSKRDHPVIGVTLRQADLYCRWRGKRLPTFWEWDWAAGGRDEHRTFTWGTQPPGDSALCWNRRHPPIGTCQVGSHPEDRTRDGVYDMAGNACEWVSPLPGQVLAAGGCWATTDPEEIKIGLRLTPGADLPQVKIGFRCASSVQPTGSEEANTRLGQYELAALRQRGHAVAEQKVQRCNEGCESASIPGAPAVFIAEPGLETHPLSILYESNPLCKTLAEKGMGGCALSIDNDKAIGAVVASLGQLRSRAASVLRNRGFLIRFDGQSVSGSAILTTHPVDATQLNDKGSLPPGAPGFQYYYQLRIAANRCERDAARSSYCGLQASCVRVAISAEGAQEAILAVDSISLEVEAALSEEIDKIIVYCSQSGQCHK
jgi:hypothetical protein